MVLELDFRQTINVSHVALDNSDIAKERLLPIFQCLID